MKWLMFLPLTAALAAAASAVAPAQAPATRSADRAARPPRPHSLVDDVGRSEFEPLLKANGMSETGIASLRGTATPASDGEALHIAECAVEKAGMASPLDVAALDRALSRRDALAAEAAGRRRAALVGWLERLDTSDAAVLLKLVGTGAGEMSPHGGPPGGPPPGGSGRPGGPPPGPPPGGGPGLRCA